MRTQLSENRRTTQDGRIWPVARDRMQSADQIRDRMIEDIAALARVDGEFAVISFDDLARKGWTTEQVRAHGSTAFNLFDARQRAAAKTATARRALAERDSGARMALDAAVVTLFAGNVAFWASLGLRRALMRLAPVITRAEPLPPEIVQAADTAAHRAGDMLMRASSLTLALRRTGPLDPGLLPSLPALAEEGRLFTAAIVGIGERIAALQERAAS